MSTTPIRVSDAPSLAEIEAFTAVVSLGTFSAAADRLGVAKSSVSRRVAALEERLGARLLQRSTRRMALTELGTRYHEQVAEALDGLQNAADAVREVQDEPQGALRITAPVDLARLMAPLVAEFSRLFPKVDVEVTFSQARVDLLRERLDLALRAGELRDSSLVARRVGGGDRIIVASANYLERHGVPQTYAELAKHEWVLFRGQHGQVTLQGPTPLVVRGSVSGDEFEFVRACVSSGAGLGFAPRFLVEDDMACGRLVRVLPGVSVGRTTLSLVYPSRQFVAAKVRVFCEFALPWFAQRLES